jgi:hypothetical protein
MTARLLERARERWKELGKAHSRERKTDAEREFLRGNVWADQKERWLVGSRELETDASLVF